MPGVGFVQQNELILSPENDPQFKSTKDIYNFKSRIDDSRGYQIISVDRFSMPFSFSNLRNSTNDMQIIVSYDSTYTGTTVDLKLPIIHKYKFSTSVEIVDALNVWLAVPANIQNACKGNHPPLTITFEWEGTPGGTGLRIRILISTDWANGVAATTNVIVTGENFGGKLSRMLGLLGAFEQQTKSAGLCVSGFTAPPVVVPNNLYIISRLLTKHSSQAIMNNRPNVAFTVPIYLFSPGAFIHYSLRKYFNIDPQTRLDLDISIEDDFGPLDLGDRDLNHAPKIHCFLHDIYDLGKVDPKI